MIYTKIRVKKEVNKALKVGDDVSLVSDGTTINVKVVFIQKPNIHNVTTYFLCNDSTMIRLCVIDENVATNIYTNDVNISEDFLDDFSVFKGLHECEINDHEYVYQSTKFVDEIRIPEINDILHYDIEGKKYKVLYVSPDFNIIVKSEVDGKERVINNKDYKLQQSFGIYQK